MNELDRQSGGGRDKRVKILIEKLSELQEKDQEEKKKYKEVDREHLEMLLIQYKATVQGYDLYLSISVTVFAVGLAGILGIVGLVDRIKDLGILFIGLGLMVVVASFVAMSMVIRRKELLEQFLESLRIFQEAIVDTMEGLLKEKKESLKELNDIRDEADALKKKNG